MNEMQLHVYDYARPSDDGSFDKYADILTIYDYLNGDKCIHFAIRPSDGNEFLRIEISSTEAYVLAKTILTMIESTRIRKEFEGE